MLLTSLVSSIMNLLLLEIKLFNLFSRETPANIHCTMQLAFALTAVSAVFTIGTANQDSFQVCLQQKAHHLLAACPHDPHSDPCTSECASAVREIPGLNPASCCAEMGAGQISKRCERMINQGVDQLEDRFSHKCPGLVDAFTSVLREVVPFAFEPQPPAAVATAQRNETGPTTRLALAAAVAGAAGASVVLAITSWKTGKQDTLLAA